MRRIARVALSRRNWNEYLRTKRGDILSAYVTELRAYDASDRSEAEFEMGIGMELDVNVGGGKRSGMFGSAKLESLARSTFCLPALFDMALFL